MTTSVIMDSPYGRDIVPLTFPIMERYAQRWGMDFRPQQFMQGELTTSGSSPAPAGTEADYDSIPYRRQLLDRYDGVVFMDSDMVVVDHSEDICLTVDDRQPFGSVNGCGLVVMKSCDLSKVFLDTIWAMREKYRRYQWLEQAAFIHLLGWSPEYPGDNQAPAWLGPTAWTPYHRVLDPKWNHGPNAEPCDNPNFLHPFGVQPYHRRLDLVRSYIKLHTDLTVNTSGE